MSRILVIEDNAGIADGLRINLELEGHEVRLAADGRHGQALARQWRPELIVLDLMLPDTDGFRVLEQLRAAGDAVPVLILSARTAEPDRVEGFRLGADDYVTKPFSLAELLGRVRAILRRSAGAAPDRVHFGEVEVDLGTHEVKLAGRPVALRPKEFALLAALLRRDGRVATRAELLEEVWRYEPDVVSRTVDIHMMELRRKLEREAAHPVHLLTVRKTGYRLSLEPSQAEGA